MQVFGILFMMSQFGEEDLLGFIWCEGVEHDGVS